MPDRGNPITRHFPDYQYDQTHYHPAEGSSAPLCAQRMMQLLYTIAKNLMLFCASPRTSEYSMRPNTWFTEKERGSVNNLDM